MSCHLLVTSYIVMAVHHVLIVMVLVLYLVGNGVTEGVKWLWKTPTPH